MNYGKAIRICRAAYGLKQAELAARLHIGPSQLSLIEAGKRSPSQRAIEDISRALQIPPSLLNLLAHEQEELSRVDPDTLRELSKSLLYMLAEAEEQPTLQFSKKKKISNEVD